MSFLYSLRLGRWGIAGFAALAFGLTWLQAVGFYLVAGSTPAERAAFGRSMTQLAAEFTVLIAPPLRPDTVGGYVQFRAYGALAIIFAVWALVSAAAAARGDEEHGLVEAVLATGVSRADALVARFLAFAAGCFAAASCASLGLAVAVDGAHETISASSLLGAAVLLSGLTVSCYALTLLVCQFTAARYATAASGALLLGLFLVNSLSRTFTWLDTWRWLSPFRYYGLSQPLPPGGTFDVRATEILFGVAVVAGLAAAIAFSYRDLGAPLLRPRATARTATRDPAASLVWRVPVLRGVYDRRAGLVAWAVGVGALGAIFAALTKEMMGPLLGLEGLAPYFRSIIQGDVYPSFLGYTWFGFAQLLIVGYAITQVARWSAEDGDGRLEMTLASPTPRGAVVIERAAVLLAGTLVIAVASGAAVGFESHLQSADLDPGRLAAASLMLVPFAMFFAAVGSVLAASLPRATVGILGAVALASYFVTQLGPIFKWPSWTQNLSAFYLYGQPLSKGVDGTGLVIMLSVVLVGFAASMFLMRGRDVGA